jgi:hypothetical protein
MPRYLLPCSCGQSIPIETIQAGQEVRCSCGQAQLAPTLREIRQLPEAELAMTQLRLMKEAWSAKRTSIFAIGLIVAALSMGAVIMCQVKIGRISSRLPSKDTMKAYEETMNAQIVESLSAEEAYEHFLRWKEEGLGDQIERAFEAEHDRIDKLKVINWGFSVVMAIGLLVTLIAALWPRKRMAAAESG